MFICKYCSKTLIRPSSIVLHEKACRENPERVSGKNQWSKGDREMSEVTRKKISEAGKLRVTSEETKKKLSESRLKYLREHPDQVPYLLNHYSKTRSYPELYWDDILKNNRIVFQSEFQVSIYRLDFAIGKIDLEIDGEQHYADKRILQSDKRRTEYLESIGWKVIRIRWSVYQKKTEEEKRQFVENLLREISPTINQ